MLCAVLLKQNENQWSVALPKHVLPLTLLVMYSCAAPHMEVLATKGCSKANAIAAAQQGKSNCFALDNYN